MGARVESTAGPLALWFGGTSRVQMQDWSQYLSFLAGPAQMPHGGLYTYRDTEMCFTVALRLPVH